jgi:hypothetical protein
LNAWFTLRPKISLGFVRVHPPDVVPALVEIQKEDSEGLN